MKQEKYLEQIKQVRDIPNLVKQIRSIFEKFEDENYIPAIIEEGQFTKDNGEDFYLKLVIKHQTIKIKETWLINNMEFGLPEPNENNPSEAFIHNVIVNRKYKSRNLYQLNPLLLSDEISEFEYNNTDLVNAYFNDEYSTLQGLPVLKSTSETKLLVLEKVFKNYVNEPESIVDSNFELVAEFEYRTHDNHFKTTKYDLNQLTDAFIRDDKDENSLYILGSVKISLPKKERKEIIRRIQVIDLHKVEPREHNPNHFNGDSTEGFVCFKPEIIDTLMRFYYLYDLQMFDKSNIENSYLIDVLGDKVVFWEAEYNKLPSAFKDKIDQYNFIPDTKGKYFSPAMFAMQLDADWNWDKKLTPDYKLANLIRERDFNRAIDLGLSFVLPKNKSDLRGFILKIESLTDIKLEQYSLVSKEAEQLINIREDKDSSIDITDLNNIYQKYCHAIQMEYKNESDK